MQISHVTEGLTVLFTSSSYLTARKAWKMVDRKDFFRSPCNVSLNFSAPNGRPWWFWVLVVCEFAKIQTNYVIEGMQESTAWQEHGDTILGRATRGFHVSLRAQSQSQNSQKMFGYCLNAAAALLNITATCCATFNYRRRDPFASCFAARANT